MNLGIHFSSIEPLTSYGVGGLRSFTDVLCFIGIMLMIVIFMVVSVVFILAGTRQIEVISGKNAPEARKNLTPTQKFILAASSPTYGNNYKCVIDIWETHTSEAEIRRAIELFEWGWGAFTYENAKNMVDECLNHGYNAKYKEYCIHEASAEVASKYTDFELELLEEMKKKYPKQGMLAWDLVRVLSIVGGAYMGGIMEYKEAVKIAFDTCKLMQENFTSWDDMVGSYTLGYQFWRGKKKKDRLKYYKRLKRMSWIYKIAWNTPLKEEEL